MAALDAYAPDVGGSTTRSVRAPVGTVPICHCPDPILPLADVPSIDTGLGADAGSLGVDVNAITDVPLRWGMTSGWRNLGNALARRLETPQGSMPDDPNYGFDVRDYLNGGFTAPQIGQIRASSAAECLKDPRVQSVDIDFTWIAASSSIRVVLTVETADGPFTFVLDVSALTVEMLDTETIQ